jgi:hypothetical protein
MNTQGNSIATDMLLGAVAGAVGVWVMDQVGWFNYRHEDPKARRRTQQVCPERIRATAQCQLDQMW